MYVKTVNHFEQNRPVHLALRDVYYDRATCLLKDPGHMTVRELNASDYEEILFLLRTARNHGFLDAARSSARVRSQCRVIAPIISSER